MDAADKFCALGGMKKTLSFSLSAALGFVVFAVGWRVYYDTLGMTPSEIFLKILTYIGGLGWLYDYQTLIGALLALAGAWWGVSAIWHQIGSAEKLEADKWQRGRDAARATLPLVLASITIYAEKCAPLLVDLLDECVEQALPKTASIPDFPPVPTEAISGVRGMMEFSTDLERRFLSTLLSKIQIQSSRVNGMKQNHARAEHSLMSMNLQAYLIDTGVIYARSAALFAFGRGTEDTMPSDILNSEIASAFHNMAIFDDTYNDLCAILGVPENSASF